jgi:hypothetical protein
MIEVGFHDQYFQYLGNSISNAVRLLFFGQSRPPDPGLHTADRAQENASGRSWLLQMPQGICYLICCLAQGQISPG